MGIDYSLFTALHCNNFINFTQNRILGMIFEIL